MTGDGAGHSALAAASGAGTVLTLFWKLAETDPAERLAASHHLLDLLAAQQALHAPMPLRHSAPEEAFLLEQDTAHAHPPSACSDAQHDRAERILDHLAAPDVAYSLRRLVRGLASPRQGARQGFAVALAELVAHLAALAPLGPDVLLSLILRASASTKSAKPAEARELLFARLFGIHALIRSRILFQDDDDAAASDEHAGHRLSPLRVMPGSNLRVFERTLDILLADIAPRKAWIRQSATWLVLQAITGLLHIDSADLSWRDDAIQLLYNRVSSAVAASSSSSTSLRLDVDTLALVLGLSPVLSPHQLKSLLCPPLASPQLLHPSNLTALARTLKELPPDDDAAPDAKPTGTGVWTPELHLVWDQLLDIYYPSSSSSTDTHAHLRAGAAPFSDFVRVLIDDSLFAPTSSPERKSWGFSVIQRILARLAAKTNAAQRIRDVPLLFQPNFVRTWINQLSDPSRILHKAARNTAQALLRTLQTTPAPAEDRSVAALALLTTLLSPPLGLRAFDQVTKTRTVEGILATLDGAGLDRYVAFLEGEVLRGAGAGPAHEADTVAAAAGENANEGARRKWAIDQLLGVVRFRAPSQHATAAAASSNENGAAAATAAVSALRDEKTVLRVLTFFVTHGWFEPASAGGSGSKAGKKAKKDGAGAILDASLRALLRARFLSAVQDLSTLSTLLPSSDGKRHRVIGVDASGGTLWVAHAWRLYKGIEADVAQWRAVRVPVEVAEGEDEVDVAEVEGGLRAAREKVEGVLKALHKRRAAGQATADRAELERLRGVEAVLTGTLLYVLDSPADAAELLEPLADAISVLLKFAVADNADEGPSADEAFVDALLGLLNRPSAFLRALATQAFGACSDLVGAGGLQLLFESLVPSDVDAMEEDDSVDDEDGSDEHSHEHADQDEEDDDEEGDDDDDDEESDTSADSDAEMDAEVDPELRSKVLKALQASGIAEKDGAAAARKGDGEDEEDDDDESDAESDVTMLDDEQMMKLDDKLASIFRVQLKGKNAAQADEHKEALAQQNKVLDLLESFATHQSHSPLALRLVNPLLSVISTADKDSKQVANRAALILRSRLAGGSKTAPPSATTPPSSTSTTLAASDVALLVADLAAVHAAVPELTEAEHVSACTSASTLLSRALLPQAAERVVAIHAETVGALFRPRGARPKPNFVRETLARTPLIAWKLRGELAAVLESGVEEKEGEGGKKVRKDYLAQVQPLLHSVLVHSLQLPEVSAKEASSFLSDFNNKICHILRAASAIPDGPPESIPNAYRLKPLRELIKFAQQASRAAQKLAASGTVFPEKACNLAGWEEALAALGVSARLGGQKALLTQVQQVVASIRSAPGGAVAQQKKNKREDVAAASPSKKRARSGEDGADGAAAAAAPNGKVVTSKAAAAPASQSSESAGKKAKKAQKAPAVANGTPEGKKKAKKAAAVV